MATNESRVPVKCRSHSLTPVKIDDGAPQAVWTNAAHWRMVENVKVKGSRRRACGEMVRVVTVEEGRVK
jgi:hypothetical protein